MTKTAELRELSLEELEGRLTETRAELFNLRFQYATGQFDRTHRFKELRRDVARILTVLGEEAAMAVDEEVVDDVETGGRRSLRARFRARRSARAARLGEANEAAAHHAGEHVEIFVPEADEPEDSEEPDEADDGDVDETIVKFDMEFVDEADDEDADEAEDATDDEEAEEPAEATDDDAESEKQ